MLVEDALQNQYASDHGREDHVLSTGKAAILVASVVTVLVSTPETLTKIVGVLVLVEVVATITVGPVLIGKGVLITELPTVQAIGPPGSKALLVALPDCFTKQIGTVLIDLEVGSIAIVAIARCGVEVRIVVVVVVSPVL